MGGRPKDGYRNHDGMQVPGTHDPLKRFTDPNGLTNWAYKRGKEGLPLYGSAEINIGSCVHSMAELDLKGATDRQIEKCAHDYLSAPDHLMAAWSSFREFRSWRETFHVRAVAQELPLVSERHQYGGTLDVVALIGNGLGIIDFKTANKQRRPYPDEWLAMRAHGELWEENHPDKILDGGYHLILLPKNGGPFQHHVKERDELDTEWEIYKHLLAAYQLEKAGAPPKRARKPQPAPSRVIGENVGVRFEPPRSPSMAEILRGYGHVKDGVAA